MNASIPFRFKSLLLIVVCMFLSYGSVWSQLSIPPGATSATIDFTNSVPNVNNGTFMSNQVPNAMPSAGGISSNAWTISGFSDNSGDLMRGTSAGSVTTGGVYAFTLGMNTFLGVQPGGSDFTPGTIDLVVVNNTGMGISEIEVSFGCYMNNDQARANSFNFGVAIDNSNAGNFTYNNNKTSIEVADALGFVLTQVTSSTYVLPAVVADGGFIYLRWFGDDVSGSGSRDEFGIDDIIVVASVLVPDPCTGDAGPAQLINEGEVAMLNATAQDMGTWSGGAGMFSNVSSGTSTYTPDPSETNTTVTLTWTSSPGASICTEAVYTTAITIREVADASFTYDPAMLCPTNGVAMPIVTGTSGIYSYAVNSGGPNLDLDPETGTITAGSSDEGLYTVTNTVTGCGNLIITGAIDGPLSGGVPKAVELYALTDIGDLSSYGLGSANNGGGTDGAEIMELPAISLSAGDYYYISSEGDGVQAFIDFFGFEPDFSDNALLINGDDAIEIFCNGIVTDVFGDINTDGSGEPWEYLDGWAYRMNDQVGNNGTFNDANWTYSGINALDGETDNASAVTPMPVGTYMNAMPPANTDATSSFDVSIEFDAEPTTGLACSGNVITTIDPATCVANLNYLMFLQGVDPAGCFNYSIDVEGVVGNLISQVGTYKVSVVSGYDGNKCWSTLTVEDKNAPILTCPLDATIECSIDPTPENVRLFGMTMVEIDGRSAFAVDNNADSHLKALNWGVGVIECSDFTLDFYDVYKKGDCDGDTIYRTFTAIDEFGKSSSCTQVIFLEPEDINDITLPNDYTCLEDNLTACPDRIEPYGTIEKSFPLTCDGAGTIWNVLPNGNPSPDDKFDAAGNKIAFGTGRIGGLNCGTIQAGFNDVRIATCLNEFNQPCDQNSPSFKVVRRWKILDWCSGALIEHNQIIKVLDSVPPVFVEIPDVTIGTSLWDCSAEYKLPIAEVTDNCSASITRTYTSTHGTIQNGKLYIADNAKTMAGDTAQVYVSYSDCCSNISIDTFQIIVIDDVPPVPVADAHTIVSLSNYNSEGLAKIYVETFDEGSYDNCGPISQGIRRMSGTCSGYSEEDDTGKYFDFIHFCCKDVGKTIMVEYQVCDDADMDGEFGTIGDLCNTAMIEVEVQDKLAPACYVPGPRSIDCIEFAVINDLVNDGKLSSSEKKQIDAMFGAADGAASCKAKIEQELTSVEECGLGTVTRKVTVTNTNNDLTSECTQIITITANPDINFLVCEDISFPSTSIEQQTFAAAGIVDVWCLMNPKNIGDTVQVGANLPAIKVMECAGVNITAPEIDYDNLCSEVGIKLTLDTFDFAGGGCKKILAHWEIIDQCQFQENYEINGEVNPFVAENGYFELYVEYDLFDKVGPEITCGEGFNAECDGSLAGELTATATDNCTDASFFGWSWRFDIGGNGTVEHQGEGNKITPALLGMETFPAGGHIVTWIVSDGCGNTTNKNCPLGFDIVDTKAPTPYCHDGLSSAVMLENGVTMWASDFDAGSFDNCGGVFVTMVPVSDIEGLSEEAAYQKSLNKVLNINSGKQEYGWNFTCAYIPNGVLATIDIRIYATDESGNTDYCTASFRLQDNLGGCPDVGEGKLMIGGNIATSKDQLVSEVEVEAMAASPEFPKYTTTDKDGNYAFTGNPEDYNYEITSVKNDDYLNGVTTLDLLLMQKHLLNIQPIENAYDLIAADINNDASIKASDLLQLRKLILGLYEGNKLPKNDSWRFVSKDYEFNDATQPWPFDEVANVEDLKTDMMDADFVAVKIGDINNTVVTSQSGNVQVRNAKTLILEIAEGSYTSGEEVKVSFRSSDFNEVYGYQFTLEFGKGLDFVGIETGSLKLGEGNFGLNRIAEGIITTSYDDVKGSTVLSDEVLFTISFKANKAVKLSESINISSKVTPAEAYVGSFEISDVSLRTNEGDKLDGFALYQNEPNPFKGTTLISFNLPEAGAASLKIYDVTGKVLYSLNGSYNKGLNSEMVKGLDATGVMYYQINAGEYSATKKMIIIE